MPLSDLNWPGIWGLGQQRKWMTRMAAKTAATSSKVAEVSKKRGRKKAP